MKKLVNKQIKAHEYLLQLKDSHEKTEHLYPSDKLQDYLQSMDITKNEKNSSLQITNVDSDKSKFLIKQQKWYSL